MRRLHPDPVESITADEAYRVERPRPATRPWVGLCMVASLDGSTAIDHRSEALSSDADRSVLVALRSLAEIVIVGAGTARIEGYGPPRRASLRIGVVSSTGNVDANSALFTSGAGFLILPESAPPTEIPSIRAGRSTVDLGAAFGQLEADFVHVEGGPRLNAGLLQADLVDELNVTISPVVAGGAGSRLAVGAGPLRHRLELAHVLEDNGFLFTRYTRLRDG